MNMKPIMSNIEVELRMVNHYLDGYLGAFADDPLMGEIISLIMKNRGKMIRPLLTVLSGKFGSNYKVSKERICKLGAIIEMVHVASLVHDDIVDDSPQRRGDPAVQSRFGKDIAVFTGDFILSRIIHHLFEEHFYEAGPVLADCVESMCRGEIGQFGCQFLTTVDMRQYLANVTGKTAALFRTACRIGAKESGCPAVVEAQLSHLGETLGLIFQIEDDLRDFLSSENQEGKPVGMDLRNGIYTMPIVYTLNEPLYGEQLKVLLTTEQWQDFSASKTNQIRTLVYEAGGIEFTRHYLSRLSKKTSILLDELPKGEASDLLENLISAMKSDNYAFRVKDFRNVSISETSSMVTSDDCLL